MRVDVKRFLFVGPLADKEKFFLEAQKAGIVEFIHSKKTRHIPLTPLAEKFAAAIKVLRGQVLGEQEIRRDLKLANKVADQILEAKKIIVQAEEEKRNVLKEIARISPYGDFSLEQIATIEKETHLKIRFYCGKGYKHLENLSESLILINSEDGIDYFIAISHNPIKHQDLLEVQVTRSLAVLRHREQDLTNTITFREEEIKELTPYNWLLHYAFVQELNRAQLDFSQSAINPMLDEKLFVIEGWVPDSQREKLYQLADSLDVICEEVAIEKNETIPTYLENKGASRVGEDIVHIYDEPSIQDKDPSVWVLLSFALFFAMIVGDAGYGLIFLGTALYLRYKVKKVKDLGKRMITLFTILAVACIIWGLSMNTFFGMHFESGPTAKYSLIDWMVKKKAEYHLAKKDDVYQYWLSKYPSIANAKDADEFMHAADTKKGNHIIEKFADNIVLEFALMIGCLHIIFGLIRYSGRNIANFAWVAFIIGAYLYLPVFIAATSITNFVFNVDKAKGAEFGLQLLLGGVGVAVLIGFFKHGIFAIFDCLHTVQIFADVMSYLRIYALGLAGGIVSATINDLAGQLPLILGIIIIIFAHGLNIILSIMGGVIHGLRLNFIEWYHYSFEGGGKQFKPLEMKTFE
jgi:V/A-type H+/Na+-transporting ATPase subunit I